MPPAAQELRGIPGLAAREHGRADPEIRARFNQKSSSPGKFVVTRQVRGQAGQSIHKSRSVLSTVMSRQVHGDETGPKSRSS